MLLFCIFRWTRFTRSPSSGGMGPLCVFMLMERFKGFLPDEVEASSTTLIPTYTPLPPVNASSLGIPTKAPTNAPTVQGVSFASTCFDNPKQYSMLVDVRIKFPGNEVVTCAETEEIVVKSTISEALSWPTDHFEKEIILGVGRCI